MKDVRLEIPVSWVPTMEDSSGHCFLMVDGNRTEAFEDEEMTVPIQNTIKYLHIDVKLPEYASMVEVIDAGIPNYQAPWWKVEDGRVSIPGLKGFTIDFPDRWHHFHVRRESFSILSYYNWINTQANLDGCQWMMETYHFSGDAICVFNVYNTLLSSCTTWRNVCLSTHNRKPCVLTGVKYLRRDGIVTVVCNGNGEIRESFHSNAGITVKESLPVYENDILVEASFEEKDVHLSILQILGFNDKMSKAQIFHVAEYSKNNWDNELAGTLLAHACTVAVEKLNNYTRQAFA